MRLARGATVRLDPPPARQGANYLVAWAPCRSPEQAETLAMSRCRATTQWSMRWGNADRAARPARRGRSPGAGATENTPVGHRWVVVDLWGGEASTACLRRRARWA